MKNADRESKCNRQETDGEITYFEGIPIQVVRGNEAAAEKQRMAIRKQIEKMRRSGDPWAMKKAEKWAWVARERKVKPFWVRALADVNPHGNIYRGLFTKTTKGWFGRVAEFPKIVAAQPSLKRATESLSIELREHLKSVDVLCDENQAANGTIIGMRSDGRATVWILPLTVKNKAQKSKPRSRPAKNLGSKI